MLVLFVSVCSMIASACAVYMARELAKQRKLLAVCYEVGHRQHLLLMAFAKQNVPLMCDECGRPIAPRVAVTVDEDDDGGVWVQHSSHD